jgi:hypothetical protein
MRVYPGMHWSRYTGLQREVLFTVQSKVTDLAGELVICTNGRPNQLRRYAYTIGQFQYEFVRIRPKRRKTRGHLQEAILRLLQAGPKNSTTIATELKTTMRNTNLSLARLLRDKEVTRRLQPVLDNRPRFVYELKRPDEPAA